MSSLAETLTRLTGLSERLAPFVVRRVCASAGVLARDLSDNDLPTVVPLLEQAIALYLSTDELDAARARLRTLIMSGQDSHP